MSSVLAANPGLAVVLALLAGGAMVFALVGLLMHRSGASLRPIVFVAGFFAIVVLPQVVGQFALAVQPGTGVVADDLVPTPPRAELPAGEQPEDWLAIYGRRMPGLQQAPARVWPSGQSLAVLRFASEAQASDALVTYLAMYSVAPSLDRGGNEVRGSRGLGGGVVHLRRDGPSLQVATALDEVALDALLAGLAGPATAPPVPGRLVEPQPLVPALQPAARWMREHVAAQVGAVLLLLAAAGAWFFRVGSWAAGVSPVRAATAAAPLPADALRARLLALASREGEGESAAPPSLRADGRIAVGFTLADARWLDATGANQRRRVHRLLLRLDPRSHTVWVTEQWAHFEGRAGGAGVQLRWSSAIGLSFFERSGSVEAGLVLGRDGRPTGALLQRERVNLQALKAPCIATVTGAGWRWRPVMLDWPALIGRSGGDER